MLDRFESKPRKTRTRLPVREVRCRGVIPAVITPCKASGQVDRAAMVRLCKTFSQQKCDGVFVIGSTGEMFLLDEEERRAMTEAAREGAGNTTLVYAGISGTGLKQIIRYARYAAADGADVAVFMVPFSVKFSQAEIYDYIRAVADASPIPVAMYHHLRMPTPIEVETVGRLAEHSNVIAIKDSSTDMERLKALVAVAKDTRLAVMQGCENLLYASLEAGACGCVSALGNVAPEWHVALFDAWTRGDKAQAQAYQERILGLCKLFALEQLKQSFSNFSYFLKRGLQLRGWLKNTACVMPGYVPEPAFDEQVVEIFRAAAPELLKAPTGSTKAK